MISQERKDLERLAEIELFGRILGNLTSDEQEEKLQILKKYEK